MNENRGDVNKLINIYMGNSKVGELEITKIEEILESEEERIKESN